MSDEIADRIDGAADAIETLGWKQFSLGNPHDGFCVMGALPWVCQGDEATQATAEALADSWKKLGIISLSRVPRVIQWNDNTCGSKQEMLDALRLAAKDQRE